MTYVDHNFNPLWLDHDQRYLLLRPEMFYIKDNQGLVPCASSQQQKCRSILFRSVFRMTLLLCMLLFRIANSNKSRGMPLPYLVSGLVDSWLPFWLVIIIKQRQVQPKFMMGGQLNLWVWHGTPVSTKAVQWQWDQSIVETASDFPWISDFIN